MIVDSLSEPAVLATALHSKLRAEAANATAQARLASGKAAILWAISISLVAVGIGLGIGTAAFLGLRGYAYVHDAKDTGEQIGNAIAMALKGTVLKTEGSVRAEGTVSLMPGGIVNLKDGTTISLDPHASILADNPKENPSFRNIEKYLTSEKEAPSASKPETGIVIFKTTAFRGLRMFTGWNFSTLNDTAPSLQFCNIKYGDDERFIQVIRIGENGKFIQPPETSPVINYKEAFNYCVWTK